MTRRHLLTSILALGLLGPAAAWAHGGHTHNALGTVTSIQGNHVAVKTTDGKTVTVMLDDKTAVTRGRTKLDATALKVGERVSVDYMQEKNMLIAKAIKLSTAAAAK